jgi:hypothetical protein
LDEPTIATPTQQDQEDAPLLPMQPLEGENDKEVEQQVEHQGKHQQVEHQGKHQEVKQEAPTQGKLQEEQDNEQEAPIQGEPEQQALGHGQ